MNPESEFEIKRDPVYPRLWRLVQTARWTIGAGSYAHCARLLEEMKQRHAQEYRDLRDRHLADAIDAQPMAPQDEKP